MKRCKICGSVVHIESNTCPRCGSHSFDVLDVKVCPLCGKVNDINSSFCEYCGKDFPATGYVEEMPEVGSYPSSGAPRGEIGSDLAETAAHKYLTLRPDISSDGAEKKYAYYVSDETVPIVILPTFETDSEKNIHVEIVLSPERRMSDGDQSPIREFSGEEEGGTKVQFSSERKTPLFTERKISRKAQAGISVLLALFALCSLVGWFLPLLGAEAVSGFSVVLAYFGAGERGLVVAEALKAGGTLGLLTLIGLCALAGLCLLNVIFQFCFLRHGRVKKAFLLLFVILSIAAFALVVVGHLLVLDATFGQIGYGAFLVFGGLLLQLLFDSLLYNR